MDYRLLGPLEARRDGEALPLGGRRQRAVLAVLALSANTTVPTDVLVDRLWAGNPPRSAVGTLQAYVSELRRTLEPDRPPRAPSQALRSTANGYRLVVAPGALDVDRFTAATARARAALAAGDAAAAAAEARAALAEWRGPALVDFADEPFAAADVVRLEESRLQAHELHLDAELAAGRHDDVVAELRSLVAAHPLRERFRGQLMLALYRCGRQADALEVARAGREQLAEELGIDPDPALQELELGILRQDPALDAPTTAASTARSARPHASGPPRGADAPGTGVGGGSDRLVGRVEERDVLARALGAAGEGAGRMVLIGGEPGIGKTRLAEAFATEVGGGLVLWGRCHETEGAPPFWPWREVLRSLAAELGDEVLQQVLGADAGVVGEVVPELADRLGATSPVRLSDAETARFHLFDAVARLLVSFARGRPVVVVLEDLHWADEASLSLLRFLAPAIRGSRLLVVATYRAVDVGDRTLLAATLGALAREPVVERLLLPGLVGEEGAALVASLLGPAVDADLVDEIVARSGGNPLFMVHLARMVEGATTRHDDPRTLIRERVPPAVVDLIGLRVAQQPEAARRLLEVGAVVGRHFELGLLVEVEGCSFDAALAALAPAVAAGLVVEDDVPGVYGFTHALMREAIVAGLGPARAGRLHGLVGDALSAHRVDAQSLPALAHHYWEASGVGWADAALDAATAAAAAAVATLAYDDARRHLDRAAHLLERRPPGEGRDRAELAVRLHAATLAMQTLGYAVADVGHACRRARELATRVADPGAFLVASWGLAAHHIVRGEHLAAVAIGTELLAAAERSGDPVAVLAGNQIAGVASMYLGRHAVAVEHLVRVIDVVRTLPREVVDRFPQDVEVGALPFLALARWFQGEEEDAAALRARAAAEARDVGGYDEVFVLMVRAQAAVLLDRPDEVLTDTAAMLARCGTTGFAHLAAHARVMRGWASAVRGGAAEGIPLLEEGLAYFAAEERSRGLSHNLTLLADALAAAGRLDEARTTATEAVRALEDGEERFFAPVTWLVRARVEADPTTARSFVARALAAADEAGAVPLRARALAALAARSDGEGRAKA